jgi:hypothetical protein
MLTACNDRLKRAVRDDTSSVFQIRLFGALLGGYVASINNLVRCFVGLLPEVPRNYWKELLRKRVDTELLCDLRTSQQLRNAYGATRLKMDIHLLRALLKFFTIQDCFVCGEDIIRRARRRGAPALQSQDGTRLPPERRFPAVLVIRVADLGRQISR